MSTIALRERPGLLAGALLAAPGRSAVATAAAIGTGVAALLQPGAIGGVVDAISRGAPAGRSLAWLAAVVATAIISGVIGTFATGTYVAKSVLFLRQRLITHVISLGPSARSKFSGGDLTSRLTLDTTTPATILPTAVTVAVSVAVAIGALVALSLIDWRLTVTFLVAVPVVMVVVRRFVVDAGNLTGHYRKLQSEIATRLLDAHAGMRTIQVSGTQAREVARVTAPLAKLTKVGPGALVEPTPGELANRPVAVHCRSVGIGRRRAGGLRWAPPAGTTCGRRRLRGFGHGWLRQPGYRHRAGPGSNRDSPGERSPNG